MELKSKNILTIVSDDYDDLEFHYPLIRLTEAGAKVTIAAEVAGKVYHGKYGLKTTSDISFESVNPKNYDGIIIPGGWAPDYLRRLPSVLSIVRSMHQDKKIIGAICHAGWVLSSAGILKDVQMTSTPGIKDDMMYAGAKWIDAPVIQDGHIVTARRPIDLPYYLPKLIELLKK
ncbi:oxidative-stress-resistance chaperone [Acholeplasma oculi]|uniref:PfpI family intracellular peptidase n=1 Tax=Acholeplasma oculi TaxID=35623 RepID=A0A061AAT7_9MOLU|nr:type 1 glutamine amidotransferase domain-containing protein [Acholeplasma oculi]CDR31010.1 PfpI family intracellular peptidase [Acholeplasma oculi]SKC36288.1 protease I [Acholeplasma oculi]SUT90467.1 oxidative-stress-resistance chaperone [Acholeplasma oculi]